MSPRSSLNLTNRTRLARALAAETGLGYQRCLQVVAGVADAGLLPAFGADTMDATVHALAPLTLLQSTPNRSKSRSTSRSERAGRASRSRSRVEDPADWQAVGTGAEADALFADGGAFTVSSFSAHDAVLSNRPPGVAITGMPGTGKSFLAFSMVRQMTRMGVQTIYLDPKADALPLVAAPGMDGARAMDLRHGEAGMLDPFGLCPDIDDAAVLAVETVRLLAGVAMSPEREEALGAAVQRVAGEADPSLSRVVDVLLGADSPEARALGLQLDVLRQLPFARLCFAPRTGRGFVPADGLTIITALGLDLPSPDSAPQDHTLGNRFALSLMYLLVAWAHQFTLPDRTVPHAIVVDDAWSLTATAQGERLVARLARTIRSANTALVLITHDPQDLMPVQQFISTVFGFRATHGDGVASTLRLLGAETTAGHRHEVRALRTGECLMRDLHGHLSRIQIEPDQDLLSAFSTNPDVRARIARAMVR